MAADAPRPTLACADRTETPQGADTSEPTSGHLAVRTLQRAGVAHLFTLSGGHIFPLYEGARHEGLRLIDVRHEQTAAFAAEGLGKLTRRPQVAALTAGPGVTNAVSAVAGARFAGSPLVVLGGRAPAATWGQGSLQEIDHTAVLGPVTKSAITAATPDAVAPAVADALRLAATPRRGPTFVDVPLDVIYAPAADAVGLAPAEPSAPPLDADALDRAATALRQAARPVVVAGTDVWLAGAWRELAGLVEQAGLPTMTNGMGRGCLPADHPLAVSRARSDALSAADLVVVVGTPLDFRLAFGRFGDAEVVHVMEHPGSLAGHVDLRAGVSGPLPVALAGLAEAAGAAAGEARQARAAFAEGLRDAARRKRAEEADLLADDRRPVHPARVMGALREVLDRDAVVIGDGGDFVSFAGKHLDSHTPGCWLDPGPYGCLGTGMGYAAAARLAHPDRQVVCLLGDGAAGFSLTDVDTLVRHDLPVVLVCGNNGEWALEKFPMQQLYDGWHAAADLRQEARYDRVVAALGGAGETVTHPAEVAAALRRGFDAGVPYLVNVVTDPGVAYPRRTVLA